MTFLLIIIHLILGIFIKPAYAQEEIVIIDAVATEGIRVGQTFPIGIAVTGADPNTTFFYKFYGGPDTENTYIQNSPSLTYSSSWDKFPTFTTDGDGNAYVNTSAYISTNRPNGTYDLFVRLAYSNFNSPAELKSFAQPIVIFGSSITPTVTPNSTPNPTSTPAPTSIPNPTATPISQHQHTVPTLTPTPTPDSKIFGTVSVSANDSVGSSNYAFTSTTEPSLDEIQVGSNSATPKIASSSSKPSFSIYSNKFARIIISITGGLILASPILLIRFKKK